MHPHASPMHCQCLYTYLTYRTYPPPSILTPIPQKESVTWPDPTAPAKSQSKPVVLSTLGLGKLIFSPLPLGWVWGWHLKPGGSGMRMKKQLSPIPSAKVPHPPQDHLGKKEKGRRREQRLILSGSSPNQAEFVPNRVCPSLIVSVKVHHEYKRMKYSSLQGVLLRDGSAIFKEVFLKKINVMGSNRRAYTEK